MRSAVARSAANGLLCTFLALSGWPIKTPEPDIRRFSYSADSVTCARCSKVFHLGCVDPPLAAKPKAGYGWSCAPCNKAYEEEIEEAAESGFRPGPPARKAGIAGGGSGNGTASPYGGSQMLHASKKGKTREVGADVRTDPHDWHMTNGWPFRYFGTSLGPALGGGIPAND